MQDVCVQEDVCLAPLEPIPRGGEASTEAGQKCEGNRAKQEDMLHCVVPVAAQGTGGACQMDTLHAGQPQGRRGSDSEVSLHELHKARVSAV